ncbi:MAG: DNA-3-methyladenine glycosylase I [Actinomycetia bacterium]|nr:DNA-3-methyladenine glycosylase I [Actinomycetes bacterium]
MNEHIVDGRCWWAGSTDDYVAYHDSEWGRPVDDDIRLFEKICLEGFQSGLSWLTILRKRDNFRSAFDDFDFARVAGYGDSDIERLVADAGIVRHRGKITSTINNARRACEMTDEFGSLGAYFWGWEPAEPEGDETSDQWPVPSTTPTSKALAKDLKKRGWSFVGPTTVYAFMQAMGIVNDHVPGCALRAEVDELRSNFSRPC